MKSWLEWLGGVHEGAEFVELRDEAERVAEEARELAGEVPFSREPLFQLQAEARVPAVVAQCHDPHTIGFFVKQQVIGKFFKIGASPAAGIEMKTLGMCFHLMAYLLEFRP